MRRAGAFLAALVLLFPMAAAAASEEGWVQIAFVHPHAPRPITNEARALFNDVNATRSQHGLNALVPDEKLNELALFVARQMADRHYFGHTDPSGVTFQDRLRASGYTYRFAAENMALDADEQRANTAFLNSPGHYRNIVDPHPHRLGIAVVSAGDGEVFYVEEFSD